MYNSREQQPDYPAYGMDPRDTPMLSHRRQVSGSTMNQPLISRNPSLKSHRSEATTKYGYEDETPPELPPFPHLGLNQAYLRSPYPGQSSPNVFGSHSYAAETPQRRPYVPPSPYAERGALINRTKTSDRARPLNAGLHWPRVRRYCRDAFSEFMGVFILVMFGNGAVSQYVLSRGTHGNWLSISWGYALGAMLGVYTAGLSGAHLNPAITFCNCVFRQFPWHKFPIYLISQTLGAFCAAGVVYANYKSAIDVYEGGPGIRTVPGYSENATAAIFAGYPADFVTKTGMFFDEFIGTALLMFMIYALKDDGNLGAGQWTPFGVFMIIFGLGTGWGWQTGFSCNLARDFGPRLMSYFVGYGGEVWTAGHHYFWVPMVAPFFGALLGGFLYDLLLFKGQSPINTPWLGLYNFIPDLRRHYEGMHWDPEADKDKEDSPV